MIKQIIFDFDGTIADSRKFTFSIYNQLAAKYKLPKITPQIMEQLRGKNLVEMCAAMKVPFYKLPIIGMEFSNIYQNKIDVLKPFPNIVEVLHALSKKGATLSIVSNNNKSNIDRFIQNHHIDIFDTITCGNYLHGKEAILKKHLEASPWKRNESIYIGDEVKDIEACHQNKLQIMAVTWGFDPTELIKRAKPSYIAQHPKEIYYQLKRRME